MLPLQTTIACLQNQAIDRRRLSLSTGPVSLNVALLVMLFVVLCCQLVIRLEIIERGYAIERLRPVVVKNDGRLRELRFEYARLTRPATLLERSRAELGFAETTPERIRRTISEGGR